MKSKGKNEKEKRPRGKDKKPFDDQRIRLIGGPLKTKESKFHADSDLHYIYSDPETIKFLVDNMVKKLANYLRNAGFDAEFMNDDRTHKKLSELAKMEKRVILTTDKKFFERYEGWPTYWIRPCETSEQFEDVIKVFKLEVKEDKILTRCVKCNNNELLTLTKNEAKCELNWKNEKEYDLYTYYIKCVKCKQMYWEGQTFKNARIRFKQYIKKEDEVQGIENVKTIEKKKEDEESFEKEDKNLKNIVEDNEIKLNKDKKSENDDMKDNVFLFS